MDYSDLKDVLEEKDVPELLNNLKKDLGEDYFKLYEILKSFLMFKYDFQVLNVFWEVIEFFKGDIEESNEFDDKKKLLELYEANNCIFDDYISDSVYGMFSNISEFFSEDVIEKFFGSFEDLLESIFKKDEKLKYFITIWVLEDFCYRIYEFIYENY